MHIEEEEDYYSAKNKLLFQTDYDRENPITKQKAIKEYYHFCLEHTKGRAQEKLRMLLLL